MAYENISESVATIALQLKRNSVNLSVAASTWRNISISARKYQRMYGWHGIWRETSGSKAA